MTDRILNDAYNLKKLMREAEALADESMLAFAKLKQAMLIARQNPAIEVDTGQRALMRLNQAEQHAMSMSTSLLRVHDELSKVAREKASGDEGVPTEITPSAIADERTVVS
ncbi:hypothetical protein P7228_08925 [Altererythrobacter arenosus]|uniref:Uncharacterized protein n=1 Tax=Altererythrobacter arenosus TaxID=3032592 RepID=A0ABY8FRU4_9SPHN|nr:hypothetical protein [Altererythrobacter sp. CAU 1644]WFL76126.1 hypothetical protein P7228_08925 [Altererythrobacter sp. CAU 1644]